MAKFFTRNPALDRFPRACRRLLAALACSAAGLAPAHAALHAWDPLDSRKPESTEADRSGWADTWKLAEGFRLETDGLVGVGRADRTLVRSINFDRDAEHFFRIDARRLGGGRGGAPDFLSVGLFAGRTGSGAQLLRVGLSSQDGYDIALAGTQSKVFGNYYEGDEFILIARLRTSETGADELSAWVWPAGAALPATLPARPLASIAAEVKGTTRVLRVSTGSKEGLQVELRQLRVGTSWGAMLGTPKVEEVKLSEYREFRPLRVSPDGVRPLIVHWSDVSLLPGAPGTPPSVLVAHSHRWMPGRSLLYPPAGPARVRQATPAPNPRLPLYDSPVVNDRLPPGRYRNLPRAAGGYDVYDMKQLARVARVHADGRLETLAVPEEIALTVPEGRTRAQAIAALSGSAGGDFFLDDVDGDTVPDLLIGKMLNVDERWTYWPRRQTPFGTDRQPDVGPNSDLEHSPGFRGYDITGNWLGGQRTMILVWARGERRSGGTLALGPETPVYFGTDDFPAQWRSYSDRLAPAVMQLDGQRHVVLVGGVDKVLALPVLPTGAGGGLHLGTARDLLAPGEPREDMILAGVVDVLDIDGDQRPDLIVASGGTGLAAVMAGDGVGRFASLGALQNLGGTVAAGTLAVPARADWDGDGRADLVTGDGTGFYLLWRGTADPLVYQSGEYLLDAQGHRIVERGGVNLQGPHEIAWGYTQAELFDWDTDGRPELIGNDNSSTLKLYRRVAGAADIRLSAETFTYKGRKLGVAWRSRVAGLPGAWRLAGDERPTLLIQQLDQTLAIAVPERAGSTRIERMVEVRHSDGSPIRLSGWGGMSGRVALSATDWDRDGKWDVLFNNVPGNLAICYDDPEDIALNDTLNTSSAFWLRNVGTNEKPLFERARRFRFADGTIPRVETHSFNVCPADLDGDGRDDLIMGDGPGALYYFLRDELSWDR